MANPQKARLGGHYGIEPNPNGVGELLRDHQFLDAVVRTFSDVDDPSVARGCFAGNDTAITGYRHIPTDTGIVPAVQFQIDHDDAPTTAVVLRITGCLDTRSRALRDLEPFRETSVGRFAIGLYGTATHEDKEHVKIGMQRTVEIVDALLQAMRVLYPSNREYCLNVWV